MAAAAAAPSSYSSLLPPIAVTPMPQNHRSKRVPSVEPTSEKAVFKDYAVVRPANSSDNLQSQISNGASFNSTGGISNVKILTKPRDQMELNASEARTASSVQLNLGNGASADKNDMGSSQNKVSSHGRPGTNLVGRQGRYPLSSCLELPRAIVLFSLQPLGESHTECFIFMFRNAGISSGSRR